MARRKKYQKLPNGYGQIRYLGKGRRNPYGVYPPAGAEYDNGQKKAPKALCYVSSRMAALAVLTSYHAGTYKPGDEVSIDKAMRDDKAGSDALEKLIGDYNRRVLAVEENKIYTFRDVFLGYYKDKFGEEYGHAGKKRKMESSMIAAYKNAAALHDMDMRSLRKDDYQAVIDDICGRLKHSSAELAKTLFHQMSGYAMSQDIIDKDYSQYAKIKIEDDDEHGVPFAWEDLRRLWAHKDDKTVEFLLIMCYSGFRISEYIGIEVNMQDRYLCGGLKTDAGRGRIVPIHSDILPLVEHRMREYGKLLTCTPGKFRTLMHKKMDELGMEQHTPHDCRHTFSALCEKYKVDERDRKRMIGHKLDLTNGVYGHRTVEELREEIEKIKFV